MGRELTEKQKLFCLELTKSGKKLDAGIAAGLSPNSAAVTASKWLKQTKIQEELARLREKMTQLAVVREDKALLDAVQVERCLDTIIISNPKDYFDEDGNFEAVKDLTEEQAYCISEVTRIETELGAHQKLKFCDKLGAIKAKMEGLGLFVKRVQEHQVRETYEQWRKRMGLDEDPG